MSNYFTTLGSDGKDHCFCIAHEDDGDYLEVHRRSKNGTSTFNERSFVTRIKIETILQYIIMKAIRKSDGKIIDVEVHGYNNDKNCPVSYHTNFKDFYKPEDLDFNVPKEPEQSSSFDWQSFRAEATKDILCHLLDDGYSGDGDNHSFVMQAIGITDELIKQLKEKEA